MKRFLFLLLLLYVQIGVVVAEVPIIFSLNGKDFERDKYKTDLIKMILDNSGIDYRLYYYQVPGDHALQVSRVKKGIVTIESFGASEELEKELIPIRIPIFKGLIGYRIFLINKHDQYKFDDVKQLKDLRRLIGIQGKGWTDVKILEDAGLHQVVVMGSLIYKMLNRGGRADYFSRAVYEAPGEIQTLKTLYPNITIEKRILITYPFAMYFYVSPKYPKLAKKVERGFRKIFDSGKFDKFFYEHPYIRNALRVANLENRIRFEIPNRYLSRETRTLPKKYWFDMNKFKSYK